MSPPSLWSLFAVVVVIEVVRRRRVRGVGCFLLVVGCCHYIVNNVAFGVGCSVNQHAHLTPMLQISVGIAESVHGRSECLLSKNK